MNQIINLWQDIRPAGDDPAPSMKTFLLPKEDKARGMVIVLPGGGYSHRAPHEGDPVALRFNELGFHAATVHYRVAPDSFPEPLRDALRSIRIARFHAKEWGINPDKIAVAGFSAGGHLAACCGTIADEVNPDAGDAVDRMDRHPNALILCYPVIRITGFGHTGSGTNLIGNSPDRERLEHLLNLDLQISEKTPPAFLWHTATDAVVQMRNSVEFAQKMWDKGLRAALHIYPDGPHGLGLGKPSPGREWIDKAEISTWPLLAADFLRFQCGF